MRVSVLTDEDCVTPPGIEFDWNFRTCMVLRHGRSVSGERNILGSTLLGAIGIVVRWGHSRNCRTLPHKAKRMRWLCGGAVEATTPRLDRGSQSEEVRERVVGEPFVRAVGEPFMRAVGEPFVRAVEVIPGSHSFVRDSAREIKYDHAREREWPKSVREREAVPSQKINLVNKR